MNLTVFFVILSVFSGYCSKKYSRPEEIIVTGVVAPAENDSRTLSWIHPGKAWASYPDGYGVQIDEFAGFRHLSTIPEPGYISHIGGVPQGEFTLSRGADPADGSKKAFRHKVSSAWDQWDPQA